MATTPEVIAQQHEEARQLLSIMECAQPSSTIEIPLSMKTCPTKDLFATVTEEEEEEKKSQEEEGTDDAPSTTTTTTPTTITSWSSRGRVDVTKLQELVREGYRIAEHTPTAPAQKAAGASSATTTSSSKKSSSATTSTNNKTNKNTSTAPKKTTTATTTNKSQQPQHHPFPQYKPSDVRSTTNLWDPINASLNNVNIMRPSHDAWGIGKIVLLFADDFLQDVYEMPWWREEDFQQAVQPILDTLEIQPTQIVRLLLASLPPQTTIPLHQDSGAWVKQTHRVHVPIIVEHVNDVIFRVGLTDDLLERIDCTPGHVFEMNNQCRHAVSNCSTDYRVHLILDYMDEEQQSFDDTTTSARQQQQQQRRRRIQLSPGEKLLQTRRSVDRLIDQGSRPTPSFLILGAQKAGTTSLYEYMMQHPLIVRPKRRETHCLDWRWKSEIASVGQNKQQPKQKQQDYSTKEHLAHCQMFYETAALKLHPSCCTGDSTPSYLLDSRRVIPNLKLVFDWYKSMKFLILTRNPIQRAESHFAMVTSTKGTPAQLKTRGDEWRNKSFDQVVKEELQQMKDCGLIPYWDMETGTCDPSSFEEFVDSSQEDQAWDLYLKKHVKLNTGSYGLLARGLYALNLRPWLKAFDANQFLVLSLEDHLNSDVVRQTMERVFDHVGVPSSFELSDVSPQNTRAYEPKLNTEMYQMLQRFFEPHNERWNRLVQSLPNNH